MGEIIQLRTFSKLQKILVPVCGFDPKKEGIVNDQGVCNVIDLLKHIEQCPLCLVIMIGCASSALYNIKKEVIKT
ncbi:hypothetical protein ES703_38855 [subsurface metagenome]